MSDWISGIGEVGRALDAVLKGAGYDGAGTLLQPLGEWLRAYQRATHYFRALNIHEPPPHLLACAVLERALHRAAKHRNARPLWLAMEEVHTLLWEQVRQRGGSSAAVLGDSVSWRVAATLLAGRASIPAGADIAGAPAPALGPERLRPLPDPLPAPMAPQSFEFFPLKRLLDVIAARILRPAFATIGRRRHA